MTIAPARPTRQGAAGPWIEDWAPLGACAKADPDALFVQGAAQQDVAMDARFDRASDVRLRDRWSSG